LNPFCADDELDALLAEICDGGHSGRIVLRDDEYEPVRREDLRLLDQAGVEQFVRVFRARGGVDVGGGALVDLRGEVVRAREVEVCIRVERLEDLGQGRRCKDREIAAGPASPAGPEQRGECDRRAGPPQRSTMTDVALTSAVAG
jgi:hypothetical protein